MSYYNEIRSDSDLQTIEEFELIRFLQRSKIPTEKPLSTLFSPKFDKIMNALFM